MICWLVVWNIFFHNIWDNPSHWLSYFSEGWLNHQPVQIAHLQNQSSYYGTFPVDPHDFLDGTNDTSNAPLNDTQNTALEGTCIQIDPNRASSLPISDQQSLLKQLILNHQSLILNKLFHHFMVFLAGHFPELGPRWQWRYLSGGADPCVETAVPGTLKSPGDGLTSVIRGWLRTIHGGWPSWWNQPCLIRRWSCTENIRKLEIPRKWRWRSNSYGNQLWFPEMMSIIIHLRILFGDVLLHIHILWYSMNTYSINVLSAAIRIIHTNPPVNQHRCGKIHHL